MSSQRLTGFDRPFAVQLDSKSRLFVGDLGSNQVHVFSADLEPLGFLSLNGLTKEKPAESGFVGPHSIAFDANRRLYLNCYYQKTVFCFSEDLSECKALIEHGKNLPFDFLLSGPATTQISPNQELVVSDYGSHSLQKFSLEGEFLGWLGMNEDGKPTQGWIKDSRPIKSSEPGGFFKVHDIAWAENGSFFVADTWNNRIQAFSEDGSFERSIDSGPDTWPTSVETQGNEIFVTECKASTVKIYRTSGELVESLSDGLFDYPYDCKVRGRTLYIADSRNQCVHLIERS